MRGVQVYGAQIQTARKSRGWTQERLAVEAAVDVKTVRRAELSQRIDARTVDKIARALAVEAGGLIAGEVEDSVRVVAQSIDLFHAWNDSHVRQDFDANFALYHPDACIHIPAAEDLPGGGLYQGADRVREQILSAFRTFKTEPMSADDYRVDVAGDKIWVRATASAVVLATGCRFTAMAVHEIEVRDGLIYRHTIVTDTASIRDGMSRDRITAK